MARAATRNSSLMEDMDDDSEVKPSRGLFANVGTPGGISEGLKPGGVHFATTTDDQRKIPGSEVPFSIIKVTADDSLCFAPFGELSPKMCMGTRFECTYKTHEANRTLRAGEGQFEGWYVKGPVTSKVGASVFIHPHLTTQEVAGLPDFEETYGSQLLTMAQWVTLFAYVRETVHSGEEPESGTVHLLLGSGEATPKKRAKVDHVSVPLDGDADTDSWLRAWNGEYATFVDSTGEELDNIRASIYRIRCHLGAPGKVTGEQGAPVWEVLKTMNATVGRLSGRVDWAVTDSKARSSEALKAGQDALAIAAESRGIAKRAGSAVALFEAGHTAHARGLQAKDLDEFADELGNKLFPALGDLSNRLLDLEKAGGVGFGGAIRAPLQPPVDVDAVSNLKRFVTDKIKALSDSLEANSYTVRGRCFRSLQTCIEFAAKSIPDGEYQWFIDLVTYLQFVSSEVVTREASQQGEIHEARVGRTAEQSTLISAFRTEVPPVFCLGAVADSKCDPLSAIASFSQWDAGDSIHGVLPRCELSLKDQKLALSGGMDMALQGHPEALGIAETLLEHTDNCWEKFSSSLGDFYRKLVMTTYGDAATDPQRKECWSVVKLMVRVFFRELRKVRIRAQTAYQSSDSTVRVGLYLWHTLQAHRVMNDFKTLKFFNHTLVAPSIVNHLFEHRAPKVQVDALELVIKAQNKTIAALEAGLKTVIKNTAQLQNKVNKL